MVCWNHGKHRVLLCQVISESEWRLSQMCGGWTGGRDYTFHLVKTVSLCPSGSLCNVLSWLVRSNCQNIFVLVYMKVDWELDEESARRTLVPVGARDNCAWVYFSFRKHSSSPESLSSSQDRSSELTSARLGVGLKSSESESASSALTTLVWLWGGGSGDAPESNRKTQIAPSCCLFECVCVSECRRTRQTYLMCVLTAKALVDVLGEWVSWAPPSALTQLICCKRWIATYER